MNSYNDKSGESMNVVLVGAGIMSATLGVLLKELQPNANIQIFERLEGAAAESSDAWNNAGTGHSAFCELNYTPEKADGTVDISKALSIAESFEVSKQFWAFLIEKNLLNAPENFIRPVPHLSFVWGEKNVNFLKTRYNNMQKNHLFKGMVYSEDKQTLASWMPLVMEGRDASEAVAATKMDIGTDVNFGALTRSMLAEIAKNPDVSIHYNHDVKDLTKTSSGGWDVKVKDLASGEKRTVSADFVFIGAGGGALPLLTKSGIKEGKGYGGFPVSGQWLKCTNPAIIERHNGKVYGKASVGAPPMSVPHLDTRMIDGKKALLFGPYAGFSTRFLKQGSLLDLPLSINFGNIRPMLAAGADNIPLTKYLIKEVMQSPEDRLKALKEYFPEAKMEDWVLEHAGQRVQIIKGHPEKGGVLEFGTEVVSAGDGSIAALLGASPGASTTVSVMITLLNKCFPTQMASSDWKAKLKAIVPSFGESLITNAALCESIREKTSAVLKLN